MVKRKAKTSKAKTMHLPKSYKEALDTLPPAEAEAIKQVLYENSERKVDSQFQNHMPLVNDEQVLDSLAAPIDEVSDSDLTSGLKAIAHSLCAMQPEEILLSLYSMQGYSRDKISALTDIAPRTISAVLERVRISYPRIGAVIYQHHASIAQIERRQKEREESNRAISNCLMNIPEKGR